jgi:hypothetical protein
VRRRALGGTFVEICINLAVVPGLCTSAFWNELFEDTHDLGGSVATVIQEKSCREQAFVREKDRKLDNTWRELHSHTPNARCLKRLFRLRPLASV